MTIPNALTLLRFCLIPLIVVMIQDKRFDVAFYLFVLAGITDAVDGYIARRFDQKSVIGAYLDPLADKFLIAASFISLLLISALPNWLVVLALFRDLMIVGAVVIAWLMDNPIPIEPILISKMNTALQIGAVSYALAVGAFGPMLPILETPLYMATALLTILSVAAYFVRWFEHMGGGEGT